MKLWEKLAVGGFLAVAVPVAVGFFGVKFWYLGTGGWHFSVPSGSMKPTLLIGDVVLVKAASDFKRGDLVVYQPRGNEQYYIGRIMGLQGDTVEMKGGVPVLNGTPVQQSRTEDFEEVYLQQGPFQTYPRCLEGSAIGLGGICVKEQYVETLSNGQSYNVLNIGESGGDSSDLVTVPPGEVFVMGDNRDNSLDSRFAERSGGHGTVPSDRVPYRIDRVHYSVDGGLRTDRLFRKVQ